MTNIVAFHSQQVVEKCFKAIIEESDLALPKIHSISRLYGCIESMITFEGDNIIIQKLDTVYTTSLYPGDLGLMPEGKPSHKLANQLYEFAKYIFENTLKTM